MVTNQQPATTREDVALREVGHTDVGPWTVRFLLIFFLLLIAAVPAFEFLSGRTAARSGGMPSWAHLTRLPVEIPARLSVEAADAGAWKRLLAGNRTVVKALVAFEDALEDDSRLGRSLRPPAQLFMTRWLGAGNELAYAGRGGWLFYRPDVEYVTGRPFLDTLQMRRRIRAAPEWTSPPAPDPRPAIVQFNRDLAARGILLIVIPTPVKPGVHPEMLAGRLAGATGVVQNASYKTLVADLRSAGVQVFDPSDAIAAARHAGPQYLATDTHWTPEAMETTAAVAAGVASAGLPAIADPGYRVERTEVRGIGDLARMLDLPDSAALRQPESVWLRRVLQPDGSLWRASRDADVLLLGDSFSNIYSLESMGWGTSAGFAEHLSLALRRPLDRLVQNDEGAFATRAMLQRDPARLQGKRVVFYQFAVRELALGDWKLLPLVP